MGHRGVRARMKVKDCRGERLGRVGRVDAQTFTYERGFPFRKRVRTRYEAVAQVRDGVVWMNQTGAQLEAEAYATPIEKERWSPA